MENLDDKCKTLYPYIKKGGNITDQSVRAHNRQMDELRIALKAGYQQSQSDIIKLIEQKIEYWKGYGPTYDLLVTEFTDLLAKIKS